jgi:hypothetical protein
MELFWVTTKIQGSWGGKLCFAYGPKQMVCNRFHLCALDRKDNRHYQQMHSKFLLLYFMLIHSYMFRPLWAILREILKQYTVSPR